MPRNRKRKNKTPNYIPVAKDHCRLRDVSYAMHYAITSGWITEKEFDEMYKQVKEKLKKDKFNA
jgi:hypothetical protein